MRTEKALCLVLSLVLPLAGCSMPDYGPMEDSAVTLLQYEPLQEGEPMALVETSMGSFTMRFFPSEAPKAVENFVTLAQQGFYDGKRIYSIACADQMEQEPCAFLSGSEDGGVTGRTIFDNIPFKNEISTNLWPFSGAVAAISGQKDRSDSRFFVTADVTVDAETAEEMRKNGFPEKVVQKFKEEGGVPGYSLRYPIFAQVTDGMDVVREIMALPTDEEQVPTEEASILRVVIYSYGNQMG